MFRTPSSFYGAAAIALTFVGCAEEAVSSEPSCADGQAFAESSTAESVVYVAATCQDAAADGSRQRPFGTIGAAITAAAEGAEIRVAAGEYAEQLVIGKSVKLVGAVDESRGIILKTPKDGAASIVLKRAGHGDAPAAIILQVPSPDALGIILKAPNPEEPAIRVEGGATVEIAGFRIVDAGVGGLEADTGTATLSWCRIEDVRGHEGLKGSGVAARGGSVLYVEHSVITGSAGAGVLFAASRGHLKASLTEESARGGVRIESSFFTEGVLIEDTEIVANTTAGVAVFGGRAIILQRTAITDTAADDKGVGDGLLITSHAGEGSEVTVRAGTTITGSARVGVLVDGVGTGASILDAVVAANGRGGIWLQDYAGDSTTEGVIVDGTVVTGNTYAGIVATTRSRLRLHDSAVLGTEMATAFAGLATIDVGDGLGLLAGATGVVDGNTFQDNGRLGIVADAVSRETVSITGNTVAEHPIGIILQNSGPDSPVVDSNTFDDNTSDVVTPKSDEEEVKLSDEQSAGVSASGQ